MAEIEYVDLECSLNQVHEGQSWPKSIGMLRIVGEFMLMSSHLMRREPHIFYDSPHLKMV